MQGNIDLIIQRRAPVSVFVNVAKNIDDALKCHNFGNIPTDDLFRIVKLIKNISVDTASSIFKMSYQKQGALSLALLEAFDFPENLTFNVLSIFSPLVHIPLFNKIYMMSKIDEREVEVDWEKQYKIEKMEAEEYKEKAEKELKELRIQNKTLDKDIRVIVKNNILRAPVKDDEKLPTIAMIGKNGRGIEELYYRLRTGAYSKYSPPIESEQAIVLNAGKKKPSARLLFLPVNAYEGKNLEQILSKCIAGYCFYEAYNKESVRFLDGILSRCLGIPLYLIALSDDGTVKDSPEILRIAANYEFRDHQGISSSRRRGIEYLDDFASRALKEKKEIKLFKKKEKNIPTIPEEITLVLVGDYCTYRIEHSVMKNLTGEECIDPFLEEPTFLYKNSNIGIASLDRVCSTFYSFFVIAARCIDMADLIVFTYVNEDGNHTDTSKYSDIYRLYKRSETKSPIYMLTVGDEMDKETSKLVSSMNFKKNYHCENIDESYIQILGFLDDCFKDYKPRT